MQTALLQKIIIIIFYLTLSFSAENRQFSYLCGKIDVVWYSRNDDGYDENCDAINFLCHFCFVSSVGV